MLGQQRADLLLEELDAIRLALRRRGEGEAPGGAR
jgi:hypothetical protein